MKKVFLLVFLFFFAIGYMFAEVAMAEPTRADMEDYAERTAELFDLSPELVKAVIDQESSWRINCKSSAGAIGLMQLMPGTGKWCCQQMGWEYDPWDYQCNIAMGCYYLKYLHDEYAKADICEEDLVYFTLIAYNRGIAGANKWIAKHDLYSNGYAKSVLQKKEALERDKFVPTEGEL